MSLFQLISIIITLSALLSFANHKWIKLPTTIGLMILSLGLSFILILLNLLGLDIFHHFVAQTLHQIQFSDTLLHGMISFLLFAGSLFVNLNDLANQKGVITILATIGLLLSTLVVGVLSFFLLPLLGIELPLIYCLLFGALISPTDPISVLGILRKIKAPKSLETKITGESLFNDGVGVVVFLVLLSIATSDSQLHLSSVLKLFGLEALGGIAYGLLLGVVGFKMLKEIDSYQVEILITLALVTGGFALGEILHVSAPIAIVVAGLLIGNHGRKLAMSDKTREHLDHFWELVDEILNASLIVVIGLEILLIRITPLLVVASLMIIIVVLLSRFISVSLPITLLKWKRTFSPKVIRILTWGGLRGGISVALALSLPESAERSIILTLTYAVVIFSIIVQGLTIKHFFPKAAS